MPLVVICGYPSSGKSTVTSKLKNFLEENEERAIRVNVVSDSVYKKNEIFGDTSKEKEIRANLKSEVNRLLGNDSVVILDSTNYIKGYRYELFCLAKSLKTNHIVIHVDVNHEVAWQWNSRRDESDLYQEDVFNALVQRFEFPDSRNRWDNPLIVVTDDGELPYDTIFDSLFMKKALRPNKSTQSIPLNATNYLYDLDRKTQDTVSAILEAQRTSYPGQELSISGSDVHLKLIKPASAGELARLRRQFITYSKMHPIEQSIIVNMFIQYLNSTCT